jgi:hypothetical protein
MEDKGMTMTRVKLLAWFIGSTVPLLPGLVSAAPFCVVSVIGTRCWYYTADACEEAAAVEGGSDTR